MIKPFAEIFFKGCKNTKAIAKKFNFKFGDLEMYRHKNGWIRVNVDWGSVNSGDLKYGQKSGEMFGGNEVAFSIDFPLVKYYYLNTEGKRSRWKTAFAIEVGLQVVDGKGFVDNDADIGFEPVFFRNLKYGVEAWFAPKGWEDYSNSVVEFSTLRKK
jgi:hypothetical protein